MRRLSLQYKLYGLLILLLGLLAATCVWLSPSENDSHREEIKPLEQKNPAEGLPQARLVPGNSVVVLNTTKGAIEFVLFERDCPKTTALIKGWVKGGKLNGVRFARRDESGLVQTAPCGKNVVPMKPELRLGLLHEKGGVGIAKWTSRTSPSGEIYILWEPWHHLDYNYVVFGRVINGLSVAEKLKVGDEIKKATLRPLTKKDKMALGRLLLTDAERRVE